MNFLKSTTARIVFAVLLGMVAIAPAASAAPTTSTFQILLDLDNNQSTGCAVPTLTGTFNGVEQILITTVTAGGPVTQVTAVQVRNCVSGSTFGPPSTVPAPAGHPLPWNIGVGNGTGGTEVIETYLPLSMVTVNPLHVVKVGVLAFDSGNVLRDELLRAQPTPGPNGPPILLNAALALVDIPTLSEWGLMLLGLMLAGAAMAVLRRRRTAASVVLALFLLGSAGLAWGAAITCDLNGNTTAEWIGGTLLATEPTSDAPVGTDMRALFSFKDGTLNALVFRIDADLPDPVFNQSPTANNDTATVTEDSGANAITVLANDSDPESDPLSIQSVTQPANGTVAITGGGTGLTYTPNANYCNNPPGTTLDTFTYTLTPGGPGTTGTVTVTVNCVDDNPVAVNDSATVAEDAGPTAVNVLTNDTDVDGGAKTITSVTQPANGTVVITGGGTGLTYQPNANYCNSVSGPLDTFTYTLTPGGSTATVSMTVTCGDDAPVAVNDATTVAEDSSANAVDVLANDTDVDGGPKSVASVTQPANGTVAITGGGTGVSYTPNADYCNNPPGTTLDTFTYTLAPGGSSATVTVTVTCADDNPVAVPDTATVTEDSSANPIDVLANDTDPDGGTKSVASVTQPANGTVVITGGGTGVSYTPNANYCNTPPGTTLDTFSYTLTPGSSSTTVTVTVTCADDNPVAVNDSATVTESSGANPIDVLANDTDIDAGPKSVASVTQPANGTVVITGGGTGVSYTPNVGYCNSLSGTPDTFTYTLAPGGSTATVSVTVSCVDDPPAANNDSATVTEDSGASAIDVLANDTDSDGGPKLVQSVTQPANGTVVITGGGTGVTYAPNPNYCNTPPGTTLDTFTYSLAPGGSTATVTVAVTCVDDSPVIDLDADDSNGTTGSDFAVTFTEGSPATLIEDPADATLTDIDSATLASLTVTITNLLDPGSEILSTDLTGTSITGNYVPATGVLTLTGPDTVANFQTVLRKVKYQDTDVDPDTTPRVIHFVANDGTSNSNTATSTVTIVATDTPPTAVADSATVAEDSSNNPIDVLANDTDPDNGSKSVASVTQPANGTVVITGGGTGVSYTPNANYCNTPPGTTLDTFTYTLTPGSSSTTVTVTVTCSDDAPVAVADAATVTEDSSANPIDVLANDTDPDGGPKSVASVTQPANGAVVITGGGTGVSYTPNANYCNTPPGTTLDTFTYTLAPGGSSTSVTVTVTCVDDNPTAVADAATVVEDSGANAINVLANDTDPDGGPKSIASVTQPANGAVVITGGGTGLTYAPNANYCNTPPGTTLDTFTYTLTPGSSSTTVTVTVTCVDDAPVAVADAATVNEDSGPNAISVLANDTDVDGGPKSVASVTQPANGTVVITGGGTGLTYAPNANYCNNPPGTTLDTFTYTLTPGSSSTTVTVTVTCVDDNPVAVADAATVTEDSGANPIDVLANDTDIDGGPKSVASVTQPANGTVVITGGGTGVSYTPNANYCNNPPGTTLSTFTYTLAPGGSSTTVTVTVTCVDDNPVAVADSATVTEDSGANAIPVLANDTDIDGGPKSVGAVTQPANGVVVITGGGTGLTYAPNANYCNNPPGTTLDTFTYTLTPGGSSTTVTVTVTCVDDPPVAVADAATVLEDSGANAINVLANDTDIDAGPKSVSSVTQPANGVVVITGGGTGLTYAPNANYCNNPPGTTLDTFTYTLTPGASSTTVTVTVTCVNDAPVLANPTITYTTPGNTQLHVAGATRPGVASVSDAQGILAKSNPSDVDGPGPLQVVPVASGTSANGGSYTLNADGSFSYVPAAGFTGTDTFTFQVTDNGSPAATATGTVSITVGQRVWYIRDVVDANNAAGGDGRSTNAFDSIAAFNAATTNNGDIIFIFRGNTGTTPLSGGIVLKDGQKLWGEGIGLTVPGFGTLVPAGTKPKINNTGGDAVSVPATAGSRQNVEIRGLDLQASGNAVDVTASGANNVGVTISDNDVTGAGLEGYDLNAGSTGTFAATLNNNAINATGNAFDARTSAATTMTVTFSNNAVNSGATGILIDGSGGGTTTITGFANNAVSQNNVGTGIAITSARFDATPTGSYQTVSGGTTVVGASGNGVGGAGVVLTNVSGDLAFTDLDIFADGGAALRITGTGAVNTGAGTGTQVTVGAGVAIFEAVGGPAVDVTNATIDLQPTSIKSTNSASTGVSLDTVTGTFAAGSGSTITNATGTDFNINAGNAAVTYSGTITDTTGRLVSVTNTTGGTKSFTGTISDTGSGTGQGIFLNANTGATISFTKQIVLSTGTNAAFTATGGGTVTATDTTSTLTTTTGVALNVANTTIGAAGLKFQSISAGTAASGPTNGIVLNNTGASGGLTVNGGTIQKTTSDGVSLTSTLNPSFSAVMIKNTGGSGVNGTGVTNFSFINGTIDTSGTAAGDSNIAFNDSTVGTENNLSGTVTITGNTLNNAFYHGVDILNYSGTVTDANISSNTLTSSTATASSQGSGIRLIAFGSATTGANITKATIANNVISNFPTGDGIQVQGGNASAGGPGTTLGTPSTANVIAITGNRVAGQSAANKLGGNGILVSLRGSGQGNFDISSNGTVANPMTNVAGIGIATSVFGPMTVTANVTNNVIVANNTFGSQGILAGIDNHFGLTDAGVLTVTITNNTVSGTDGNGIYALARNSSATLKAKIQNNTVAAPLGGVRPGIRVDSGSASGSTTVCLNISGNTSAGSGGTNGLGLRKQGTVPGTNAFGVNGMAATSTPGVETYVNGLNPAGNGTLLISATSGFTNCSLP